MGLPQWAIDLIENFQEADFEWGPFEPGSISPPPPLTSREAVANYIVKFVQYGIDNGQLDCCIEYAYAHGEQRLRLL